MKQLKKNFKMTEISKVCALMCVAGLMAASANVAMANDYNINAATNISVATTTNSIAVYNYIAGYGSNVFSGGNISLNLSAGVSLLGQTDRGNVPLAVYTYPVADGGNTDLVTFSGNTSTLTLNGNNQITGLVGAYWAGGTTLYADPLSSIQIYNGGNVFNNQVFANSINLNSGSTVQFLGDLGGKIDPSQPTYTTNLNYQGSNSQVTLGNGVTVNGSITNTSISNSSLIFNGTGTVTGSVGSSSTGIGTVQVNGNGSTVQVNGNLSTDHLDYQAASTVRVGGNLYLNVNTAVNAVNAVTFANTAGVLQVDGDIVGILGKNTITTTVANTGTVTMIAGPQNITGNVGSSGLSIGALNIGGTGGDVSTSSTAISGNVFANTISLNNGDSTLTMNSGYNLTGTVVTEYNGTGNLTLAGGTQTVTGTVGANGLTLNTVTSGATGANSTFTGVIYATNVNNSGTGTSNYQSNVIATSVGVGAGTSNFQQSLNATTTTIGTGGTGNFNTLGGTTTSNILFSGAGTANLNQGLTGAINFAGNAGTVNLADGKTISGAITTSTANTGVVNALGAGTLSSDVGNGNAINQLNINTLGTSSKTVNANGNVYAQSISLQNDGVLVMADTKNLTGTVTTTANNTGSLNLTGTTTVTGNVGTSSASLKAINGAADTKTDTFNSGVVYATTLNYTGNGTFVFNGATGKTAPVFTSGSLSSGGGDLGFVGSVDFGTNVTNTGTFTLGDSVDLVTAHAVGAATNTQTAFKDANGATLTFAGSSVITGDLGSAANTNNENFKEVWAGANGKTVSFLGNVYVASTTFHVSGTGNVNFFGNLNGPLVYNADGTVNVADGKNITGAVTTLTNGTGTLNFVGSAATQAPIGDSGLMLKAVNFHAATSDSNALPVTNQVEAVNIGHNVYALTTTIGTGSAKTSTANATTAYVTSNVFLGNALTLAGPVAAASNVTLNTAGDVYPTVDVSPVDFAHTKNADGTLTNAATVTRSTTGTGAITTNGATLNFAIGTTPWASNAGGTVNTAASSRITGGTGSTLVMNGYETVNLSLLGSLKNGQNYTLVDVTGGVVSGNASVPRTLNDNSYVIDTALTRANGGSGDLVVTATRSADVYITKGLNTDHFSNPAALRLGTLAAAGSSYSSDIQTVLNKLDIDQWGFGNNQANLAVQAQRLAPIANNSVGLSTFRMSSMISDSIGMRMQELRIPETAKAYEAKDFWIRSMYQRGKESSVAGYDGFKSDISGFSMGLDAHPNRDSLVGVALSYGNAKIKQQDFRLGDQATVNGWNLSLYGAYDITKEWFVDGIVTGSNLKLDSQRTAVVGRVAKADPDINQVTGKLNMGYRFKFANSATTLTPIISLEGSTMKQDAYQETGAGDIGLSVASQRLNWTQSGVGLRLATVSSWGGLVAKPELTVMAQHQAGNFAKPISAQFIGDNTVDAVFQTAVADKGAYSSNSVRATLGVGLLMSKTSSLSLRYDYSKSDTFKSNAAELFARWDF